MEEYVNAGYSLVLWDFGKVGAGTFSLDGYNNTTGAFESSNARNFNTYDEFKPSVFVAYKAGTGEYAHVLVVGGNSGRPIIEKGSGTLDALNLPKLPELGAPKDFLESQYNQIANATKIDLLSGAVNYTPPADLATGGGPFPFSLSFQRSYSTARLTAATRYLRPHTANDPEEPYGYAETPMGLGWSHNFMIEASLGSSGMDGMGRVLARDAAATVAALNAVYQMERETAAITSSTDQIKQRVVSNLIINWMVENYRHNIATVTGPDFTETFVRPWYDVAGFKAPAGSLSTLTQGGTLERGKGFVGSSCTTHGARCVASLRPSYARVTFTYTRKSGEVMTFAARTDRQTQEQFLPVSRPVFPISTWKVRGPSAVPTVSFTYVARRRLQSITNGTKTLTLLYTAPAYVGPDAISGVKDQTNRQAGFTYTTFRGGEATADFLKPAPALATSTDVQGNTTTYKYAAPGWTGLPTGGLPAGTMFNSTGWSGQRIRNNHGNLVQVLLPKATEAEQQFSTSPDEEVSLPAGPIVTIGYGGPGYPTYVDDVEGNRTYYYTGDYYAAIMDPLGYVSKTYFDEKGRTSFEIAKNGAHSRTYYDRIGRVRLKTAPIGTVDEPGWTTTESYYDARHNVSKVRTIPWDDPDVTTDTPTDADIHEVRTDYHATFNLPVKIREGSTADFAGTILRVTDITYNTSGDGIGKPSQLQEASGQFWANYAMSSGRPTHSLTYGAYGLPASYTDANGVVTEYTYDSYGQLTGQTVDPTGLSIETTYEYDAQGNPWRVVDPMGNVTTATYDSMRRPLTVDKPLNLTAKWEYDNDGFIVEASVYDRTNIAATKRGTRYDYYRTGRVRTVRQFDVSAPANDRWTLTFYDALNRKRFVRDAGQAGQMSWAYDPMGSVIEERRSVVDPDSTVSSQLGFVSARRQYNLAGQVITVQDGQGVLSNAATRYVYDKLGRLYRTWYPETSGNLATYEQATYNIFGETASFRNRRGHVFNSTYDSSGRLINLDKLNEGYAHAMLYDVMGRLTWQTEHRGSPDPDVNYTIYSYDKAGRTKQKVRWAGSLAGASGDKWRAADYSYDDNGNLTSLRHPYGPSQPENFQVYYTYDALNRPIGAFEGATEIGHLQYNVHGLTKAWYGAADEANAAVVSSYTSNAFGEVSTIAHGLKVKTPVLRDVTFTNTYNRAGQLSGAHMTNSDYIWLPPQNDVQTATHNELNQVASAGSSGGAPYPTDNYAYDKSGNLLGFGTPGVSTRWLKFLYDSENKLISADVNLPAWGNAQGEATFQYDVMGRRDRSLITTPSGSTDTWYWTDGEAIILEWAGNGNAASRDLPTTNAIRRHVYWPGSYTPFATFEVNTSNVITARHYLVADRIGSIFLTADSSGNMTGTRKFSSFGETTGTAPTRFGYTGHYLHNELGLYFARARFYAPYMGRFLQVDPIGYEQSLNSYHYAANDPNKYSDPTGRVLDTVLDVVSLVDSVVGCAGGDTISCAFIALDVAALVTPGATGTGIAKAAYGAGEEVAEAATKQVGQEVLAQGIEKATTETFQGTAKLLDGVGESLGVVYRRIDTTGQILPYVGQAKSEARFLKRQAEHARKFPNSKFEFEILDRATPGVDLDVTEHFYIQELTGGISANASPLVSNLKDPVGSTRRSILGLPEPGK